MTRRHQRHALPVLLAALLCGVLPVTALADPGKGHGRGQRDDSGYEQYRDQRDDSDDQRGNGKGRGQKSERGYSGQKHQDDDAYYDDGRSRGEDSGRGRSRQQYRDSDDNDDDYYDRQGQRYSLSPQEAAQRARSEYGGQVLKVQPAGDGYQVRLLQRDGRVVTVPIGD